ncbi:MAG: hypothetical protein JF607_24100, partial [Burkholderiales bacterium]|nr:hypothetical protein [Burkholderiales bacterium]
MRRGYWLAGAALAGLIAWWAWPREAGQAPAQALAATSHLALPAAASAASAPLAMAPFTEAAARTRLTQHDEWLKRLERAQLTLAHYRESTRYPPESRPIADHPDQVQPFAPIRESLPLRFPGSKAAVLGVRILTTQDRVFMSGDETAKISVTAQDEAGRTLPLLVTRAVAFDLPDPRQAAGPPQLALDMANCDGVYSAQFQPSHTAFADFAGTLRLQLTLSQGGRQG